MPGALVLAPFSACQLDRLRGKIEVTYESWLDTHRIQDPEELGARLAAECVSVLVIEADFVFEEVFEAAKSLRLVGVCRGSVDHVDIEAATRHGVVVVNAPGRNAQSVAEHVLALMLSLARRIPSAHAYVKRGQWENPAEPYVSMRGVELLGRNLGIVGLGTIGRRLATIGLALGMDVAAHDPYVSDAPSGVSLMDLDDLLA
ncbi:MAG: NAD(P)-dependent oxidoreductase, partial [Chloroflexi bacterium]|nr:NAD(P)-dependent oxidoreductase [Chloroflexota bacterium]